MRIVGLHNVNADTLVAVIKDVVLRMNLDLHNCRGQCYDGAANMAGSRTGTATQLRHVEERAIFTHCYGHALNLAVADVVKQSKVIRDVWNNKYTRAQGRMLQQSCKPPLAPSSQISFFLLLYYPWCTNQDKCTPCIHIMGISDYVCFPLPPFLPPMFISGT